MSAETLNCPMCGASVKTDATRCEHCGTRLATVACPSCFGMMFVGSKFCSHCGARADRTEVSSTDQRCPRCKIRMNAVAVGNRSLRECSRCGGLWADVTTLEQLCADRDQQAALLGAATPIPTTLTGTVEKNIRYVPCPVCGKLMNRVNFARCSHVIVDVCKGHGTWFDKDELRRIVEFIRSGGLEVARAKEMADLEERRRRLQAEQVADAWSPRRLDPGADYGERQSGIAAVARLLGDLLS